MEKIKLAVFTVCNIAYLNKTLALADSLLKYNGTKLDIFIIDGKREIDLGDVDCCNLHWIEDYNVPNFKMLAFKYDIIELSTCLKPFIALALLNEYDRVIFFDPDVMVFSDLSSIEYELERHSVVVTPHYFLPKETGDINDWRLMRFGFHNLGFFAVKSNKEAHSFLNWWKLRCFEDCYNDSQYGIFTDQKWVNIALGFFPFIYSSFNPGFNVAFWNVDQRRIEIVDGKYYIEDKPLVFLHFSAFDNNNPQNLSRRSFSIGENSKQIIGRLGEDYYDTLRKYDNCVKVSNKIYTFDYMSDGTYINPVLRRAFGAKMSMLNQNADPFDINGEVAKFARKNYLLKRNAKRYVAKGYNDLNNASAKKKLELLFIFLRMVLRIIGPNRFMNLSRLMIYLSGYNRNAQMWK